MQGYEKGIWIENENRVPNPGDIIFYDWDDNGSGDNKGSADHVGIVEKVSGNIITVIEGNYNNCVARRNLEVNGKYIRGYGVPKYDAEAVVSKSVTAVAKEVIAGKWGNGADRKARLTNAGYDYAEVQAEVNRLCGATKKDLNAVAKKVCLGAYGNGAARTNKLKSEGYSDVEIKEIQRIVNAMFK